MAEARDLQESISLTSDLPSHNESPNGSDGNETEDDVSYETIRRVPYTLILTICYVTLALVTWVLTCVLMHRPISAKSYDIHILNDSSLNDGGLYHEAATGFSKTKAYLRAIKVLEAIASVVTIPMTSAVCSSVAVVLLQRPPARGRRGYTLRQMMTLSDKLWTDPLLISKLATGGWKRYGSIFLLCAILLNLLGASISPVQNLVQSYESHKVLAKDDVSSGDVNPETIAAKDFQVRTTTGYFELPNYANKQFPGPLLSDGPNPHCSRQCRNQGWGESFLKPNVSSDSLWLRQRAPLYATTMAVFGNGSVFDKDYTKLWGLASAIPTCALLLQDDADPRRECESHHFGLDAKNKEIAAIEANTDRVDAARSFLSLFTAAQDSSATATSIERAFTAAAMIFIDEWHEQGDHQSFYIARRLGMDLQIPHMAKSGIILVSTMLGVFLSSLLGLAIYSAITPRWTAQLDSFAMMRIGASIAPELPFRLCRDASDVKVLDTLPGWVGEAPTGSSPRTGEISLGETKGLRSKRRYAYYRRKHAAKKKRAQANQASQGR